LALEALNKENEVHYDVIRPLLLLYV